MYPFGRRNVCSFIRSQSGVIITLTKCVYQLPILNLFSRSAYYDKNYDPGHTTAAGL